MFRLIGNPFAGSFGVHFAITVFRQSVGLSGSICFDVLRFCFGRAVFCANVAICGESAWWIEMLSVLPRLPPHTMDSDGSCPTRFSLVSRGIL